MYLGVYFVHHEMEDIDCTAESIFKVEPEVKEEPAEVSDSENESRKTMVVDPALVLNFETKQEGGADEDEDDLDMEEEVKPPVAIFLQPYEDDDKRENISEDPQAADLDAMDDAVVPEFISSHLAPPSSSSSQRPPFVGIHQTMDIEEVLLLVFLLRKRQRRKNQRKHWVQPLLQTRLEKGLFHTLYDDLRSSDSKFFVHFGMKKSTFDELLSKVEISLRRQDTRLRKSILPEEKLALFLRYLGQGCTMTDLHITYRIGLSTVSTIIRDVCNALWNSWKQHCFPDLTADLLSRSAVGFESKAKFPNCVGAIDGKHIRIIKPGNNTGSQRFNYKQYFSILLLAMCDVYYKFLYVDVGVYGKSSDSTIFKKTQFHKNLVDKKIQMPLSRPLPGQIVDTPFMIVGDEGFGLSPFVLRPFGGTYLPHKKKIFNYRLGRARRYVDCAFGILTNKWRIFHRPLNVDVELAEDLIKVTCMLHNFVLERDGYTFEDTLSIDASFNEMVSDGSQVGRTVNEIRDQFAEYFVSDAGAIPCQDQMI